MATAGTCPDHPGQRAAGRTAPGDRRDPELGLQRERARRQATPKRGLRREVRSPLVNDVIGVICILRGSRGLGALCEEIEVGRLGRDMRGNSRPDAPSSSLALL